jgi:hypothetical protein
MDERSLLSGLAAVSLRLGALAHVASPQTVAADSTGQLDVIVSHLEACAAALSLRRFEGLVDRLERVACVGTIAGALPLPASVDVIDRLSELTARIEVVAEGRTNGRVG